jgi:NAD(P)-dependent dehydrogenase (short-subunit alcohol dehydrogenase family)
MSNQRTVVVTGASSGFGRLTAEAFAAAGWRVYATLRDAAGRNAAAAGELRRDGIAVVELDVTDDASVAAAAEAIHAQAGAVDVLVNNAGSAFFGILEAYTPAAAERQFATNVIGPLRVNRAFLPAMRERKSGLVVYVSSVVGRLILPFGGVYTASKWALEALAETSSYELAPFGIDVAIVEPGAFATDIFSKVASADDEERLRSYGPVAADAELRVAAIEASGAGRDPHDVAKAILRLAGAAPGTRPLRTVVPANPAVEAINAALEPIQRNVLAGLDLGAYLPKTTA